MSRRVAFLFVLAVAACGARSSLFEASGASASSTTASSASGSGGAATTGSSASTSAGGVGGIGPGPACLVWQVDSPAPVALTDPTGDALLTGFASEGDRVFVATMNNDSPSTDPTWRVRVVTDDLVNLGTSHVVATHSPTALIAGIGVASHDGARAALLWDGGQGCRFFQLDVDGAPGPATSIGSEWCYWLDPSTSGFTAFQSQTLDFAPVNLLGLSIAGALTSSATSVVPTQPHATQPLRHVRFDDGSTLLLWSDGSTSVASQHLDASGAPVSPIQAQLLPLDLPMIVGLTSFGDRALLAWTTSSTKDEMFAMPIDEDANPIGPKVMLAPTDGLSIPSLDLARFDDTALLAWTKGEPGIASQLFAETLDMNGNATIAPLLVPATDIVSAVRIARTKDGALLLFDGEASGGPVQVFASILGCSD